MTDLSNDDDTTVPKPGQSQGQSGERAGKASERLEGTDADNPDRKQRQEALIDEAVEETFPASDPISPKRIT